MNNSLYFVLMVSEEREMTMGDGEMVRCEMVSENS